MANLEMYYRYCWERPKTPGPINTSNIFIISTTIVTDITKSAQLHAGYTFQLSIVHFLNWQNLFFSSNKAPCA